MKLRPIITIEAEITVNNREAEMLLFMTDYNLAEWFSAKCSTKYTADVIKKTLGQLRTQLRAVVDAHDRAMTTIVEGKREREEIS